ncbi:MAG: hypothetical protein IJE08_06040 [Clostridia bacterium]|nr:hypothetical protein [Clostridia bacterium]
MLYPKNQDAQLRDGLFKNPTSEYRGTPFWAWNGKLDKEELLRQIRIFKKMGLGGFHMHVRTGMDTPYLTEEFMDFIRFCVQAAKDEEMLAWLYDEDRWPSGTAGGSVTKDKPESARKSLLLTTKPYAPDRPNLSMKPEPGRGQESMRQDNGTLLAVYDICLNEDGTLASAELIGEHDTARGTKWYAYQEHATADPWFNNQAYVDTLKEEAIDLFIKNTHEVYHKGVGDDFGKVIPAIFTDEPQFTPKSTLAFAGEQKDVFLPWTDGLCERYRALYGENLYQAIPELLWELPGGKLSAARWQFQNMLTDLFVETYCRKIGSWCREHGIALTGHVMGEQTLASQTQAVGDAMRCYRQFGIPGIDMLCDFHEYTTAKQTQSMVHQTGAEGMLSELYGVTGWDYDFRGYKLQGDWQAALGVTVRVPHLAWMTMKGEAKRDYPASISYQSPWWDQFSMIENHFARLNTALTRGQAKVRVAVVHPIESYWMHWGPSDQTEAVRSQMEKQFDELAKTLLFGGIDFDYLCEAELPVLCGEAGNPLKVGKMEYDAVIVPPLTTIRSTTIERLNAFREAGGALIVTGECPGYVDAHASGAAKELYEKAKRVSFDQSAILGALEPFRFIDIRRMDGSRENRLLHQLRKDGDKLWLFVCNGVNPGCPDVDDAGRLRFTLRGEYALTLYDTMTGEIRPVSAVYQGGMTVLERQWYIHESMLLLLTPGRGEEAVKEEKCAQNAPDMIFGKVSVELEEPNMLLLDMAEYSMNGGEFYAADELLRIDNIARRKLNIPVRRKEVVQPYLVEKEEAKDFLTLRFRVPSEVPVSGARLALEEPGQAQIRLNGETVEIKEDGWYVDRAIKTICLPDIKCGENIMEITVPIGRRTNLEAFYLLGDFGVRVSGTEKTIISPVRELGFSDITQQGLPFYTGNIVYRFRISADDGRFTVRVPRYRGGLVKVFVDGEDAGNIAFSPYRLDVTTEPGEHEVAVRLYGTRQNGFAQLHHTPGVYFYQSPNSWRSAGDLWCYEYQLKPAGILKSPEIYGAQVLTGSSGVKSGAVMHEHMTDLS